ncbi:MAG: phosphodiester glycosidase family protein [Oscillospiraceae bacterium]|nr:phosphodiester glycosidase family protein [Oscillospiraceae bacterium]
MNLSLFAEQQEKPVSGTASLQQPDSPAETAAAPQKAEAESSSDSEDAGTGQTDASPAETETSAASAAGSSAAPNNGNPAPKTANSEAKTGNTPAKSDQPAEKAVTTAPQTTEPPAPVTEAPPPEPVYLNDDTHYQDENISIALSEYSWYDTSVYVADIQLSSAQYLKTAFAKDTYGRNITAPTSEIAAGKGAILAVNGDFYGTHTHGYVIRNGVLYRDVPRDNTDYLCITADGSFFITTDDEYSAQELVDMGVWQCFMFGPRLIENGAIAVDENSEVARSMASNPRTAVGQIDALHYVFVVSDGRTSESDGLSLSQLAEVMQSFGVQTAYNLDGGGSTTMYFNGAVINNPTTSGRTIRERSVSDIVYIGY